MTKEGSTTNFPDFISEPIVPDAGTFDVASLARGEPGMPAGFTWRETHYAITRLCDSWKESEAESHNSTSERYYRKRFFVVEVDDGSVMTLYALRHVKAGANQKQRWWLYTIQQQQ